MNYTFSKQELTDALVMYLNRHHHVKWKEGDVVKVTIMNGISVTLEVSNQIEAELKKGAL